MATALNLEIHLKDGKCKVVEGATKRTYFSTEEAVGLALLRLNPANTGGEVKWQDFLAKRGVAVGLSAGRTLILMVTAPRERTLSWRRSGDHPVQTFKVMMPATLLALAYVQGKMVKSQLWLVKPGLEDKLTCTLTENVLVAYPYGNVYNHGGICWGTANLKDIQRPEDVEEAFFGSAFNADLFYPSVLGYREGLLPDIMAITQGVLPLPPAANYGSSVASVVRGLQG